MIMTLSATKPRNKCAICKHWDGSRPPSPLCGYYCIEKDSEGVCSCDNSEYNESTSNALNECECFKIHVDYLPSTVSKERETLKVLHIPKEIEAVSEKIARDFKSLEEIIVDKENKVFCSVDGVLFSKDKKKLILYPPKRKNKNFRLTNELIVIGDNCIAADTEFDVLDIGINTVVDVTTSPFDVCKIRAYSADVDNKRYRTQDGVLYSKDMSKLIFYPNYKEDYSFKVPYEVEEIDCNAEFCFNEYLYEISIHENCDFDISDIMQSNIETIHIIR